VNKSDLIRAVAAQANLSLAASRRSVESMFSTITKVVADGKSVHLLRFGSFLRTQSGRISTSDIPRFRPSSNFKKRVASDTTDPLKVAYSDLKMLRRFELVDDRSSRFFEIFVKELCITRKFGTIGKTGYKRESFYKDVTTLERAYDQFVDNRILSGYQECKAFIPDKIRWRSLARLHERQVRPDVRKAIRIYASTNRLFCRPEFKPIDIHNPTDRVADQIIGGLPYLSSDHQWPVDNRGNHLQFLAQIDLTRAGRLLKEDFADGVLQIWASEESWENLELRRIGVGELSRPIETPTALYSQWLECGSGLISTKDLRVLGRPRIQWKDAGMMHYPDVWSRICAEGEETEVIDPGELKGLFDDLMAQDEWRRSIQVPTFSGLRGKSIPHVYLGGYPLAEGNGWNLHHPKRRSLINIWFDSGVLWHLCVAREESGEFSANLSCSR
jgi:nucleoid DNA-binding protein/predicted DNA-binding WGR domain protein